MALVTLSFPPGLYANGTLNQARGRWYDANLVRFFSGSVRPVGGWERHLADGEAPLAGKTRAILSWTDNAGVRWIAAGGASKIYSITRLGEVADITPSGLVTGDADAIVGGGYGSGSYSAGGSVYGAAVGDDELILPATCVSFDTFGENLIGVSSADGRLFLWNRTGVATFVFGAPDNNRALVVDETGHILLLGADGDRRLVAWCDAQDETNWTPGLPSEAGNFPLQTGGNLMCGKRVRGGTLLLTDQDAWLAIYNGGANPFAFEQVGQGCGVISQGALASAGSTLAVWMGRDGFWAFNGSVQPIPCDVLDRVFGGLNMTLASHVTAFHNREFAEITWYYPAGENPSDNNSYVTWNYHENHWTTGELARTCATDDGAFEYPLKVDPAGMVWRHESGFDYAGAEAFVESGPAQFAADGETPGERVFTALNLIPDENSLGDVEATFYGRFHPTAEVTTFGPYTAGEPTNVRFTTRHLRMRLTGQGGDWRVGDFKLDITLGGLR